MDVDGVVSSFKLSVRVPGPSSVGVEVGDNVAAATDVD